MLLLIDVKVVERVDDVSVIELVFVTVGAHRANDKLALNRRRIRHIQVVLFALHQVGGYFGVGEVERLMLVLHTLINGYMHLIRFGIA